MKTSKIEKGLLSGLLVCVLAAMLNFCLLVSAKAQTASVYGPNEALRSSSLITGVIVDMRAVEIAPSAIKQTATTAVGAGVGGLLCSKGASNYQNAAAAGLLCSFLGGVAADKLAQATMSQRAVEIVVKTTDNRMLTVTQQAEVNGLAIGASVYVLSGSSVRVVPVTIAQAAPV